MVLDGYYIRLYSRAEVGEEAAQRALVLAHEGLDARSAQMLEGLQHHSEYFLQPNGRRLLEIYEGGANG